MNGSLYSALAFGEMQPDPATKREIDRLLKTEYKKVKALLAANRDAVIAVAETLLQKDELDGDELEAIVAEAERKRTGVVAGPPTPLPVDQPIPDAVKPLAPPAESDVAAFRSDLPGVGDHSALDDVDDGRKTPHHD
jgi:hypothetical protein